MKTKLIFFFSLLMITSLFTAAQVEVNVEEKVERKVNQRANSRTDQAIDKGLDKLEEGIGKLFGKKKKKNKSQDQPEQQKQTNQDIQQQTQVYEQEVQAPNVKWAKYDFVPGDKVIFEDGPSTDEENGEFPSRWDLYKGSAEIGEVDGEPVIIFLDGGGSIVPYIKNSDEDYLPDVFTVEFDVWFEKRQSTSNRYFIHFRDQKNQWNKGLGDYLKVNPTGLEFANTDKRYPGTEHLNWSEEPTGKWRHISIAYTKGKFKAYMDDTRLINVPHLEGNPWGITIRALSDKMYLKNFRFAEGGVKYYDSILSDGKIIVNGIRFDVNKATIKPESNGAINEIYQLMEKQTDLNFSVEGHTDSDGDDQLNQSLSEQRAKAVMERLVSMGISSNRLKSAGWGESKPIGENGTAEGKANNRRVEFVKFEGNSASSNSSDNSNSAFDKLDRKTIGVKLEEDNSSEGGVTLAYIPITNATGIVNGKGTIILYASTDGNLGKMEILDVDKNDNYKLTIKYVTYNYDGSVHSQSDNIEIAGTFSCDLDEGKSGDVPRSVAEFQLGRQDKVTTSLHQTDETILRVLSN